MRVRIQRRATKIIPEQRFLNYKKNARRLRGDLIEVSKILLLGMKILIEICFFH